MNDIRFKREADQYLTRYAHFLNRFRELTGIQDADLAQHHYEMFMDSFCECEDCEESDCSVIHITVEDLTDANADAEEEGC